MFTSIKVMLGTDWLNKDIIYSPDLMIRFCEKSNGCYVTSKGNETRKTYFLNIDTAEKFSFCI